MRSVTQTHIIASKCWFVAGKVSDYASSSEDEDLKGPILQESGRSIRRDQSPTKNESFRL
jgi:hypothetical protein